MACDSQGSKLSPANSAGIFIQCYVTFLVFDLFFFFFDPICILTGPTVRLGFVGCRDKLLSFLTGFDVLWLIKFGVWL